MKQIKKLYDNNRSWASKISASNPKFFENLVHQQTPEFLWIGCADSRVPANEIVDLAPGELFVHRNVANVVVHTDLNCLSVLQYAVDVLKVKYVIVCGHYGCGGVQAAFERRKLGLIDNWLRHVRDVMMKHEAELNRLEDPVKQLRRLYQLNAIEQAVNVCETTIVQNAWERGQKLIVHAMIYGLDDGLLEDLNFSVDGEQALAAIGYKI